uniref:amino acid adenylation domain-containing protein n=1 Tax=Aldersonia kunmingensis TaxID=408066 RepID=UPI000AB3E408
MVRKGFDGFGDETVADHAQGEPEVFPLSPAQLGLWFAQQLIPSVPINIANFVELHGDLDIELLERVSAEEGRAFGSVFIRLVERDGIPAQWVDFDQPAPLTYVDLRSESDPQAAAAAWMQADMSAPVDLLNDMLCRAAALQLGDRHWYWYSCAHHIVLDGFGALTNMQRIAQHYTAAVAGEEIAPNRAQDIRSLYEAEQTYRGSTRFDKDGEYWANRIAGIESGTSLAARPAPPAPKADVTSAALSELQSDLLDAAVAANDSSPAGIVLAAFAAYLAQFTDSSDVVLSLPVAARTTAVTRRSAGMMSNVVPLRVQIADDTTVGDLLTAVGVEVVGALRHQRYRHEDIRRDSPADNTTRSFFGPWVNIMLFDTELKFGEMNGQLNVLSTGTCEDLNLTFYESGEGGRKTIDFISNPNMYTLDEARLHHDRFMRFLERFLAAEPNTPVWQIDALTSDERHTALVEWNATAVHEVPDGTLRDLLDAQAARTPDNTAIVFEDEALDFAEFHARVNRLARWLIADGVGPESLVALGMRRSLDLVIGMHAVLAAGGAYVPIDPDHPVDRTSYILDAASPVCLLTTTRDEFTTTAPVQVVEIDRLDLDSFATHPIAAAERLAPLRPDNTAYVIFTSGSTGKPKGVAVSHRAIVNQMLWMADHYGLNADDVFLQKTATTFDVSLYCFFLPFIVGAKLIVADPDGHRDPRYVADMIERHCVTVTDFVPSMLTVFVSHVPAAQIATLRHIFAIGEALPPETATAFRILCDGDLHNLYGPTEAAVSVTHHTVSELDVVTVPMGGAEWNVELFVLDSRLRPVAIGATGELYLAGRQLARGYLNRPDLSSDRFTANPFGAPGERMYRTGDLVRWLPPSADEPANGNAIAELDYLGRSDFQVKFRGQRIELGEIESALLQNDSVSQAVVLVADSATGQHLVGYVVPAPGATPEPQQLIDAASGVLPVYMVPAAIVVLAEFPLNPSGKLDRKALPQPVFAVDSGQYLEPRTPAEEIVAGIFADVLEQDRVGAEDNFFSLGGNSLVAARLVARVDEVFGTRIGVRAIFESPTVAGLAARAESAAREGDSSFGLRTVTRPDRVPLSYAQQRMWFLNRYDAESSAYNLPVVIRLAGELDVAALRAALGDVLARHESLRTRYPEHDGVPYQLVVTAEEAAPALEPVSVAFDGSHSVLAEFVSAGFDVAEQIPFRAGLFRISATEHVLAVVAHHISADGWSMGPLARDMVMAYSARSAQAAPAWTPLPVQYADFAVWQRQVLGSESDPSSVLSAQAEYWRSTLAGIPDELGLPTDRLRPNVQSFAGGRVDFSIESDLRSALSGIARDNGATEFMVVHAALALLLARISATDDVAIGTPIAGRGERDLDDLIGMFVNTLVLRSRVEPGMTFLQFLQQVRETDLRAFANADLPFERLVELLHPQRSASRHPLFQVALSFENLPPINAELPGLSLSQVDLAAELARFDLELTLRESEGGGMAASLSYARDLFDESTVRGFADRFILLLNTIVAQSDTAIGDLPVLSNVEYTLLTQVDGDAGVERELFADLLTRAVALDPDKTAVRYAGRSISYRELDEYSSRLAGVLIDRGVGPETLVALALPRSYEMVAAVWAVAKAGGAHIPVDPNYPADRVAYMLTDSSAVLGITATAQVDGLPGDVEWLVLDTPGTDEMLAGYPPVRPVPAAPVRPGNTAYVIYTSGSTGRPKGVAVTHGGLAALTEYATGLYGVESDSRFLHVCSPSFDPSVLEWTATFSRGATLVIVPAGVIGGPELIDLLVTERVTHGMITPAVLGTMDPAMLPELVMVQTGGDVCTPEVAARWAPGRRFFNGYGPTETTIISSYAKLEAGAAVTIGTPVPGTSALVLDDRLHPVPVGVAGELYLWGGALARGYHARPGQTAGRFVPSPWGAPGARMYRTGDVVRWNAVDSAPSLGDPSTATLELEYVGRSDFQVKVRGYRIELGEIDAAVAAHPDVDFATTVAHQTASGATMLVTYVTPQRGRSVDTNDVTFFVARSLPSHMVPASVVVIDSVPLTPVGKLDRKALPAPVFETREFRAPSTPIEEIVAGIFTEVLGVNRVGADDDFFELGGNSLSATQVASRLGAALNVTVPVRLVFDAPMVSALAARAELDTDRGGRQPLVAGERPEVMPLSLAQQRMWFLNQFDRSLSADNIAVAIRLRGELDIAAMQLALIDVIERHESLRTVFPSSPTGATQVILTAAHAVPDLTPIVVTAEELPRLLGEASMTNFDVTSEVPLHAELFELDDTEHVLMMVVNHISADGWSMGPLARDVMLAYSVRTEWQPPEWATLPVQYADFALWQRELLGSEDNPESLISRQLDYWTKTLAGLPDEIGLPKDRPRPAVATLAGAEVGFEIPAELHKQIDGLARRHNATRFMVVHAALAVLLARLSDGDDIAIGTPVAGRGEAALDDLIGMFVNTLVLRTEIQPAESFTGLLERVCESDLAAFGHADVPFERLVEVLNPVRSQARHPLFQVGLAFQNLGPVRFDLPGLSVEGIDAPVLTAKFDLHITLTENPGDNSGIAGSIEYATDMFDAATVSEFAARFVRLLDAAVSDPAVPVGDIELLTSAERTLVVSEF